MPPSARIPPAVWEAQRERITSLYVDQDKTLDDVIQHMAKYHGFHASKPQYIRKVTLNWELRKNSKKEEWERASALISKRKAEGKATQLMMNGKVVSHKKRKKEMRRYPPSQSQQTSASMGSDVFNAVVACTPPSSDRMHISFCTLPSFRLREILRLSVPVHGVHFGSDQRVPLSDALSSWSRSLSNDFATVAEATKSSIPTNINRNMADLITQKTTPGCLSILSELVPTRHDLQAWLQSDESPSLQLFRSLVFLSTNNMLVDSNAIDHFLKSAISNGFLRDLKQILSVTGPTVKTFAMHLLFASLRIESEDSLQFLHFLLQNGISANSVESHDDGGANQRSALQVAVKAQNEAAVELLLIFEANPNEFPISLGIGSPLNLSLELSSSNSTIVQMLIDAGANVNFFHPEGHRWGIGLPLTQAVKSMDLNYAELLLKAGANPNLIDPWSLTALHHAVDRRDLGMLNVLLEAGADPNILCSVHNLRFVVKKRLRGGPQCRWTRIYTPIQEAVHRGDIAIAKRLIDAGAILEDGLEPDLYNDLVSPFLSEWEARDIVRALFDSEESDMADFVSIIDANDCGRHRYLSSPLQVTCGMKPGEVKRKMVELLLSQGSDISTSPASFAGRTTLQAAAGVGDYDLVEDLLSRGANPSVPGAEYKGLTALQAAVRSGSIDVVDLLLSSVQRQLGLADTRPIWRDGTNYLEAAAYSGNMQMLDIIFESTFDSEYQCSDDHVVSALRAAVENSSISMVQRLLDTSLNAGIESHACSIICDTIWRGNDEIFDVLMDRFAGVDLDITLPDQPTPLWVAIHGNEKDMAQRLIEAGANVDQLSPSICPLNCHQGFGVELESPMREAIGGFCFAISRDSLDWIGMVSMLVKAGADVNRFSDQNYSPLFLATFLERFDIAEYLLRNGADPNLGGLESGEVPLQVIMTSRYMHSIDEILSFVRLLLEAGAIVDVPPNDTYPWTALQGAILSGKKELAHLFMEAGADVNFPAFWQKGHTALQAAASVGNLELVKSLVAQGVDVNAEPATEYGATALQFAAIKGHVNMAIFLLENGALINAPPAPQHGRTALEGAAEHGRLDMIYLLLENDQEPDTIEKRCQDAAKFAEAEEFPVIAKLLREYKRP